MGQAVYPEALVIELPFFINPVEPLAPTKL